MMPPIAAAVSRKSRMLWLVGLGMEMQPVAQHGGQRARRAVGRRGDDAAAGGVLLVDRHGVDRQPVVGEQRVRPVGAPFLLQLVVQRPRAAAHLQPARHDAVLRQAAVDAAAHRLPDARRAPRRAFRAACGLPRSPASSRRWTGRSSPPSPASRRHSRRDRAPALPASSGPCAFSRCSSSSETTKPPPIE